MPIRVCHYYEVMILLVVKAMRHGREPKKLLRQENRHPIGEFKARVSERSYVKKTSNNRQFSMRGLFFAFGVPCLFGVAAVSGINNYYAAKSWKMTQATVAQSELIKEPKNWHAKIVYSYEVDGQRYWSDRISPRWQMWNLFVR